MRFFLFSIVAYFFFFFTSFVHICMHITDVYLSTITDCLDFENDVVQEEKDDYQKYNEKGKKYTAPEPLPLPLSIISSSIGEITTKDIMIASAANGKEYYE